MTSGTSSARVTAAESRPLSAVIFSKDRPLQLESCLASLFLRCDDSEQMRVSVLYTTSSPYEEGLYQQLRLEYPDAVFKRERDFRRDVLSLVHQSEFVAFVVDDAMFVRRFAVQTVIDQLRSNNRALAFSLRLGTNTTYCYTVDSQQDVPEFTSPRPGVLAFRWPGASLDFGYPFDLSSSVFRTVEIEPLLSRLAFANPNTMEAKLVTRAPAFGERQPELLCFERSVAFCIPANLVQAVAKNRTGGRANESPEALAAVFERGGRIDLSRYDDFPNNACHQDVPLYLRPADPPAPAVSVVIPCYEQAAFLGDAVASVIAQTMPDWEIVIVDDGSKDNTAQAAQELVDRYPKHRIRLLRQPNQGVSIARNNGIAISTGRYILPLDADDMLKPQLLERAVAVLDADPSISIAYSDYELTGASSLLVRTGIWDHFHECAENQLGYCSLYRRGVWAQVGGYNSRQLHFEDYDYWLACLESGAKAERIPESLFLYRARPGTRTDAAAGHRAGLLRELERNHPALYTPRLRLQRFFYWRWRGLIWRFRALRRRVS